ncbi:hypothetical protein D3C78_1071620 [compost metagenome]
MLADIRQYLQGVEPVGDHAARTAQIAGEEVDAGGMCERTDMQHRIVHAQPVLHGVKVVAQLVLQAFDGIGHPFGLARRPRGIGNAREVRGGVDLHAGRPGLSRCRQRRIVDRCRGCKAQCDHMAQRGHLRLQCLGKTCEFRSEQHRADLGVVQDVRMLQRGMPGIEGHVGQPGLFRGKDTNNAVHAVVQQHRKAVSRP